MKKLLLLSILSTIFCTAFSQVNLEPFTKINVSGVTTITIENSDSYAIGFPDNIIASKLEYNVEDGTLYLKSIGEEKNLSVYAPLIEEINSKTIVKIKTNNTFKTPTLKIFSNGASEYQMNLECDNLIIEGKGASDFRLKGNVNFMSAELSGASKLNAYDLTVKSAKINTSAAAKAYVFVTDTLDVNSTSASEVKYKGNPASLKLISEGISQINNKNSFSEKKYGCLDDEADTCTKNSKKKFNGHLAGIDLLFNNFMSSTGKLGKAPNYTFMEPKFSKSFGVQINFLEFNLPIARSEKIAFGLTTGMSYNFLNYRLNAKTRLYEDSTILMAWQDTVNTCVKSKLAANYLSIPILFEINNYKNLHFSIGGFGGVRLFSHTKVVTKTNNDKEKIKQNGDFHLNPFRYGLTARIGFYNIDLTANYCLSEMFVKNEGPAVHPIEFGLSINF
ncbi:MAG: outer membrane beta-barrel protein [Bacteroidales bacterium]|nr:outer membrane beta-barrel protein [Bacteroidales bacterium]